MKYAKMLALAAAAASAVMALIGVSSASATVICSTTTDPCPAGQAWPNGTAVDWSIPSGSSIQITDTEGDTRDTCTSSTAKWEITNTGSSTETLTGKVVETTFGGCTFTTDTTQLGKWEIHKIAGTSNGRVTSAGPTNFTIETVLFGSCIYAVQTGQSMGEVNEGKGTGASIAINAFTVRAIGSAIACPETTKWSGTYVLTLPTNTTLSVSASGS